LDIDHSKPLVLFDGSCGFCNSTVQFILKHEKEDDIIFISSLSDEYQLLVKPYSLPQEMNSVIVIYNNIISQKSSAALMICQWLKWPFSMLRFLKIAPRFIRDAIYDLIADNRHSISSNSKNCVLDSEKDTERIFI